MLVTIAGKHKGADSQISFCISDNCFGSSSVRTWSALVIIACKVKGCVPRGVTSFWDRKASISRSNELSPCLAVKRI